MELPIFIFVVACLVTSALAEDKWRLSFRAEEQNKDVPDDSCDEPVVRVEFPKLFSRMKFDAELYDGANTVVGDQQATGSPVFNADDIHEILIRKQGLKSGCSYATAELHKGSRKVLSLYRASEIGSVEYFKFLPAEWRFGFEASEPLECAWLEVDLTQLYENVHFVAKRDKVRKTSASLKTFFLEQIPVGPKLGFTDSNMEKVTIRPGITVGGLDPDCRYERAHLYRKLPFQKQAHVMTFVAKGDVTETDFDMSHKLASSIRESKLRGGVANIEQAVYFKPADKWTLVFKPSARGSVADEQTLTVVNKKMIVECDTNGKLNELSAKKGGNAIFQNAIFQNEIFLRDEMEDGNPTSRLEGFDVTMVKGCNYKQLVIYRWPDVKTKGGRAQIATYDLPMARAVRQSFANNPWMTGANAAKTKSAKRSRKAHRSKKGSR